MSVPQCTALRVTAAEGLKNVFSQSKVRKGGGEQVTRISVIMHKESVTVKGGICSVLGRCLLCAGQVSVQPAVCCVFSAFVG